MGDEEEAPEEEPVEEPVEGAEDGDDGDDEDGEGNPCVSCCLGLIIFPVSLILLALNERNYVCTANQLQSLSGTAMTAECGKPPAADSTFFFSCPYDTNSFPEWQLSNFTDGNNNTNFNGGEFKWQSVAAKVDYQVQQCTETSTNKKVNGKNVKTYKHKVEFVPAGSFEKPSQCSKATTTCGAQACASFTPSFSDEIMYAAQVQAGAYTLTEDLLKFGLDSFEPVPNAPQEVFPSGSCSAQKIGCEKLSFQQSTATHVSVFAKSKGSSGDLDKIAFPSAWGCSAESTWFIIQGTDKLDLQTALMTLLSQNDTQVWILRIVLTIFSILGVYFILSPISYAADKLGDVLNMIPCVGGYLEDAVEGVVGAVVCGIACGVGCCCSLFVISIFWLLLRPLYGGSLLAVALCCCGAAVYYRSSEGAPNKGKKKKKKGEAELTDYSQQQHMAQPMAQPMMAQPVMQQPMQQTYNIQVPPGYGPGMSVPFMTPDGRQLTAQVPDGFSEGMAFQVMA